MFDMSLRCTDVECMGARWRGKIVRTHPLNSLLSVWSPLYMGNSKKWVNSVHLAWSVTDHFCLSPQRISGSFQQQFPKSYCSLNQPTNIGIIIYLFLLAWMRQRLSSLWYTFNLLNVYLFQDWGREWNHICKGGLHQSGLRKVDRTDAGLCSSRILRSNSVVVNSWSLHEVTDGSTLNCAGLKCRELQWTGLKWAVVAGGRIKKKKL